MSRPAADYAREMPGWHINVINYGLRDGPHKIIITTPTGHHYLSRAPDSPMTTSCQKRRIGSIRSAKINTTPEIRIRPPTTYATGSSLAVSTGPGSGRPKRRAMTRLTAS
jgi:hypothetical protein